MPSNMRASTMSSAASEKRRYVRVLRTASGTRVVTSNVMRSVSKNNCKRARHRTGDVVRSRRVVGIGRSVDQRLPGRIRRSVRIAVIGGLDDGRDRPPEDVVDLAVPAADQGVGRRHVRQRKEPRLVARPAQVARRDPSQCAVPLRRYVPTVEVREIRLLGAARGARERTERFHLVEVLRVAVARQCRRRLGRKRLGLVSVKGSRLPIHGAAIGENGGGAGGLPRKDGVGRQTPISLRRRRAAEEDSDSHAAREVFRRLPARRRRRRGRRSDPCRRGSCDRSDRVSPA